MEKKRYYPKIVNETVFAKPTDLHAKVFAHEIKNIVYSALKEKHGFKPNVLTEWKLNGNDIECAIIDNIGDNE